MMAKKHKRNDCSACGMSLTARGCLRDVCNPCRKKNCSHSEFHYDSALNKICSICGTCLHKQRRYGARITKEQEETARTLLKDGMSIDDVVEKMNIPTGVIARISAGNYRPIKAVFG